MSVSDRFSFEESWSLGSIAAQDMPWPRTSIFEHRSRLGSSRNAHAPFKQALTGPNSYPRTPSEATGTPLQARFGRFTFSFVLLASLPPTSTPTPTASKHALPFPFPVKAAAAIVAPTTTTSFSATTLAPSLLAPASFPAPGLRLLPHRRRRRHCGVASGLPFLVHHRVGASAAPRST